MANATSLNRNLLSRPLENRRQLTLTSARLTTGYIEFGLLFVLAESFLRRISPEYNLYFLAFKFVYFPFLYVLLFTQMERGFNRNVVLFSVYLWMLWGIALSLFSAFSYPITHAIGTLVNVEFFPLVFLGISCYDDPALVRGLFRRLSLFSAAAGLLALLQVNLPSSHWLNVSMDFESNATVGRGGVTRVTSFFQHCNVFGTFVSLGLIAGLGWANLAQRRRERWAAVSCMGLLYMGGIVSGSRMATLGGLATLLVGLSLMKQRTKKLLALAGAGALMLGIILFVAPKKLEGVIQASQTRAFETDSYGDSLTERIKQFYFGSNFYEGWLASQGVGTGWGPYTMGATRYSEVLGNEYIDEYWEVESGYSIVLAQTGVVGLVLFAVVHCSLLFRSALRSGALPWLTATLAVWSLIGNLPLSLLEVPVVAIPWWLLLGIALNGRNMPGSLPGNIATRGRRTLQTASCT